MRAGQGPIDIAYEASEVAIRHISWRPGSVSPYIALQAGNVTGLHNLIHYVKFRQGGYEVIRDADLTTKITDLTVFWSGWGDRESYLVCTDDGIFCSDINGGSRAVLCLRSTDLSSTPVSLSPWQTNALTVAVGLRNGGVIAYDARSRSKHEKVGSMPHRIDHLAPVGDSAYEILAQDITGKASLFDVRYGRSALRDVCQGFSACKRRGFLIVNDRMMLAPFDHSITNQSLACWSLVDPPGPQPASPLSIKSLLAVELDTSAVRSLHIEALVMMDTHRSCADGVERCFAKCDSEVAYINM